jgi:hypothetical protein
MNRRGVTILIGYLFTGIYSFAQITPVLSSSSDKIIIGEPFKIKLEIKAIDRSASVQWKLPDTIAHFEYISIDSSKQFEREITITSFDSGLWTIDNISVIVPSNVNNKLQALSFPQKEILVEYDTTGNQLMNDVKPIIDVDATQKWIGYIVAAAALLSLIALIILFRRWKKKKTQLSDEQNEKYSALEDFLMSTEKLKTQSWETQLEQKQNFTEISIAIKKYFERSLHKPFTRLTTNDLALELKAYLLQEQLIPIIQNLKLSDAVKFAKYHIAKQDCLQALQDIESAIKKTETELKRNA